MSRIDSHQHYWQLGRFDYGWIETTNAALYQDRLPTDLCPEMESAGIQRAVLVHAANTPEEIPWLLRLTSEYPYIEGVVGWMNLTARNARVALAGFARHPRFKGVRLHLPVANEDRTALDDGLQALAENQLSCDLLLGPAALSQAAELVAAHPGVTFVIDHLAGVRLTAGRITAFALAIEPLAARPNVMMKLSGYLTAAADTPPREMTHTIQPYIKVALDKFGPGRLMFGSDWPVCTQAGSYADAVSTLQSTLGSLSADELAMIWGGTATRAYKLED